MVNGRQRKQSRAGIVRQRNRDDRDRKRQTDNEREIKT